MDVVVAYAIAALGVGWWGATLRGRLRRNRRAKAALANFDGDAEVAIALAKHEAQVRGQPIAPLHLAYALVQDQRVADAIRACGGNPDAIETRILHALDGPADAGPPGMTTSDPTRDDLREVANAIAFAGAIALEGYHRQATVTDLWARLAATSARAVLADGPATPLAVLFRLAHGLPEPALTLPGERDVHVVLRNDDYTTKEFVVVLLRDLFDLPEARATELMESTHAGGVARVARLPADAARTKIETARARARDAGYPLWLGVEPC